MKHKILLALASASAMFTAVTFSQPAHAAGCVVTCHQQYQLCLANTPHAAADCREFLRSCVAGCDNQ